MPRISFRDYLTPGARPWWEHTIDAGQDVAKGISQAHAEGREDEQLASRQGEVDRKLSIEESNAKARLLEQSNRATVLGARQKAEDADRAAAVQGLQELAGQQEKDAVRKALEAATKSPEGVLGPFGLRSKFLIDAAKGAAEVQGRMAPKIALAQEMSPAGARMYLEREGNAEKQRAISDGFQTEADAVLGGVAEGWITPQEGQELVKALQTGVKTGGAPGEVHKRVVLLRHKAVEQKKRAAGWEEADRKAGELVTMLEQMAANAQIPSVQEKIRGMAAKAKGEWARTLPLGEGDESDFRSKHDGADQLAALEGLVFEAQAADEQPLTGIRYSPKPPPPPTRGEFLNGIAGMGGARGGEARGGSQEAPGARQAAGGSAPQPEAANGQGDAGAQRGAYRTISPANKAQVSQQVLRFVTDNGHAALEQGSDRPAEIRKLRLGLAKDLGLDPADPFVEGSLVSALLKVREGRGAPVPAAGRPKKKPAKATRTQMIRGGGHMEVPS